MARHMGSVSHFGLEGSQMVATNGIKDFWGNDAIDFGSIVEMTDKYADNIFVFVTDKPFGDGYVLFLGNEDEEDVAYSWLANYDAKMKDRGIGAYGSGVSWGYNVNCRRTQNFIGSIRYERLAVHA
jgi:hypothetical protein